MLHDPPDPPPAPGLGGGAADERNLGEQPIKKVLEALGLAAKDLVAASTEQITFKMVSKACKGRRLSANVRGKILKALEKAAGKPFAMKDLFDYE